MSSSPKTISSSEQYVPSAGEQPNINSAFQQMYSLFNNPQGMYPGQTFVGASPYTQQAIGGMAGTAPQLYDQSQQFGDAWSRGLNASDISNNQNVQDMMSANQSAVMDNLNRNMLPGIQQGAVQGGGMNSSRQGIAQGVALGDSSQALANANAATQMGAYNSGLQHEQAMMGQSGNLSTMMGKPWEALSQAGQGVEGYQQKALNDAMTRYGFDNNQANSMLNNLINQLGGMKYGTQVGQKTNPNYQDPLTSMFKMGAGIAGLPAGGAAGAPMSLGGKLFGKSPGVS